ncbi:unnamed protein product [Adineta steineri]|uniref:Claudin n=1 Tax=Adineta steineri TaxID=433720 RepID=A0A819R2U7_9BILA|nr:unnamed protein product [Adineta steineri]
MAFESPKIALFTCGMLVIVSGLYITANALPMWVTKSVESDTVTVGLWKLCVKHEDISKCDSLPLSMDGKIMATRAFITICCILFSLSVILILSIMLVNENLKMYMSLIAHVLVVSNVISGTIGVGVGISMVEDVIKIVDAHKIADARMGLSCILAIIAVALNLASAFMTGLIK